MQHKQLYIKNGKLYHSCKTLITKNTVSQIEEYISKHWRKPLIENRQACS